MEVRGKAANAMKPTEFSQDQFAGAHPSDKRPWWQVGRYRAMGRFFNLEARRFPSSFRVPRSLPLRNTRPNDPPKCAA
jgi:hypothetical protein